MKNLKYIWLNGKFIPFQKANFHLLTHSLHYGSAVFEGIRCYKTQNGPAIFRLPDHIKRLFHSADVMGIKVGYSQEQVIGTIKHLIIKNKLEECYIRPIIFFGEKMGLNPRGASIYFAIATWPWGKYLAKEAVSVKVSKYIRVHHKSSVMTAKISGNYANSVIATLEAHKAGFDEALLLDYKGNVAEGPGENIFFVRASTLYTPRKEAILPGITRDSIIKIGRDLDYRTIEKDIKIKDLKNFDEAFFVGTATEVNAIGRINQIKFNSGKEGEVTKNIKRMYLKVVHGEIKKYNKWLTYLK